MSIWATMFSIEDEREWVADMEAAGIKAGVIRDGDPDPEDLDAPVIYQGSHVMPDDRDARGGSVQIAYVPAHVRYYREMDYASLPDVEKRVVSAAEPEFPVEPWLRLSVQQNKATYRHEDCIGDADVLLTRDQATRLRDALTEWLSLSDPEQSC